MSNRDDAEMNDVTSKSSPKRLALCVTDLEVGGAERCVAEIATRIDRAGFSPEVFCLTPRPAEGPRSLAIRLEAADVPVHFLDAAGPKDTIRVLRRLTLKWKAARPDIVQSFLFHANMLARIAARRARVPTVFSGLRVAERRGRWRLTADRWTAGWVDRHVCVSQAVADFSAREGGLPAERLVVIPNGIDVEIYRNAAPVDPRQFGIPDGARAITYVGRLDRQKGLDWLLEAAAGWNNRLPEHHLLLVGDGLERTALKKQAEVLGISSQVHFAGWRADVPNVLAASEMLVLPSRWEGMPNAVLEAMAAGRAVVASDVQGVRELLGPSAELQTVPFGDTEEIVSKVVAIAESKTARATLGQENALRAAGEFSIDRMVRRYQVLYTDLSRR